LEPTTTSASGGRVYGEDVLIVTVPSAVGIDEELRAVTEDGEDRGPVTDLIGSVNAPWVSRDGRFVGFRFAPSGQGDVGPWTIKMMNADGSVVDLFAPSPQGIVCQRRVAWHPQRPEVLLACTEDADGDGVEDTQVSTIYNGPVDADGRVDGQRLERVLGVEDPLEDRPEGSPSSRMRGLSVLPTGELLVSYYGGEEPGIHIAGPDGIRRVTSGERDDAPTVSTTGLVAFVRDGDLYVVATDGSAPPCPSPRELSQDPITGASLCNLTGDATFAENRAQDPAWSWDGSRIAFLLETGKEQRTLVVTDLAKAGPLRPVIGETANLGGIAWGPR
jgi:hypothetical protein